MSKYYSSSIAFGAEQTKTEQVVVSPTKIGNVTTDAVSGALTVDEVPVLNSLNPVSSDGVARAVIQAGAELPTRGSSDTGKVLTVANSDGDLEWDEPAEELPDMAGNDGKLLGAVDNNGTMEARWVNPPDSYPTVAGNANKVLTVNSGATGVEWANVPTELPSIAGNASKVLKVNDGATAVEWADESKELPNASSADNGKVLGVTDTSGTLDWVAQTPAQVNADWNSSSGVSEILNKPTIPTVDQNYNAASTNAQSGVAVAQAIADISVDEVPTVGSTDDGKVLTASYSGGQGSYSWETAQGGGGASYTAGNGIRIDANDEISVKTDASLVSGEFDTYQIGTERITIGYQFIPTQLKTLSATVSCSAVPAEVKASIVLYYSNSRYAVYDTDTVIGSYSDGNVTYTNNVVIDIPTDNSKWTFTGTPFDVSGTIPSGFSMYVCATGSTGSYGGMQQLPLKVDVSTYAFQRNHSELHVARPVPTPDTDGKVLTVKSNASTGYGYQWQALPTWSSDYGASVDNATHKINVTAITPADKQINVLGTTNVPNMTLNLVNPTMVPDFTTIPAYVVRAGELGEDFDCVWVSAKISSSRYPGLDNGSAVTMYLNIPNDVVLTGSYSGATLSSTGFNVSDAYGYNDINITSTVIDSSNILKIPAGRYAVTFDMSRVYNSTMLELYVNSWLESGGNKVALDSADKTLILAAMEDWTFDAPKASGHYEMDIPRIIQVNALPANPDANTLYLIPET